MSDWRDDPTIGPHGYPIDPRLLHLTDDELAELNRQTRQALEQLERESDGVMDGVMDGSSKPDPDPPALEDDPTRPPKDCPDPMWFRPLFDDSGDRVAGHRSAMRCKRWSCESCGPRRRVEVLKQVRLGAGEVSDDQPLRFLTVTFPMEVGAEFTRSGVAEVNERFRRFVQQMRRQHLSLEYAKTLETTKRGRLHVHAIVRGSYLPKCHKAGRRRHGLEPKSGECYCQGSAAAAACTDTRCRDRRQHRRPCIQRTAWDMGLGFVEIRKIRSTEAAAAYVAKYLTKASPNVHHGRPWPKYARRYSASRRWASKTLGQIHRDYIDSLRRRGVIPEPDPAVIGWVRVDPPDKLAAAARGGRHRSGAPPAMRVAPVPPGRRLDRRTGELIHDPSSLPAPF